MINFGPDGNLSPQRDDFIPQRLQFGHQPLLKFPVRRAHLSADHFRHDVHALIQLRGRYAIARHRCWFSQGGACNPLGNPALFVMMLRWWWWWWRWPRYAIPKFTRSLFLRPLLASGQGGVSQGKRRSRAM